MSGNCRSPECTREALPGEAWCPAHHPDLARWLRKERFVTGLTIEECNFNGAGLSRLAFTDCRLIRCHITGSTLARTTFESCDFIETSLTRSNGRGMMLTKCTIRSGIWSNAAFIRLKLSDCTIEGLTLRGSNLGKMEARDTIFSGVHSDRCRFARASFTSCTFKELTLNASSGKHLHLDSALMESVQVDRSSFQKINLLGSRVTDLHGETLSFRKGRFEEIALEKVALTRPDLRHAYLLSVKGHDVTLTQPLLEKSRWVACSLAGSITDPDVILSKVGLVLQDDGTYASSV